MGEAFRNPELAEVLGRQDAADAPPEVRRANADVDGDVVDLAEGSADELALGPGKLGVEAAQGAAARAAVVVLDEAGSEAGRGVFLGVPGLEEEASIIAVHGRFDEQDFGQGRGRDPQARASPDESGAGRMPRNQPQSLAAAGSL